ncbi:MAG: hypothetical protein ABGW81_03720, partial [Paracoccaceae bacterium]
ALAVFPLDCYDAVGDGVPALHGLPGVVLGAVFVLAQIELPADILGERRPFLQDSMTIQIEYFDDEALSAALPQRVTCTVTETEPAVKGQTAANSFKPAILDNGVRVMIPPFVGEGEAIVVSTETMEYVERA